jgi:hypothetical protein
MLAKTGALINKLPGKTTRKELAKATVPPLYAFVRAGIRMTIAGVLYFYGMHHAATVVAILAIISLVGVVEAQIAKSIATSLPKIGIYFRKTYRAAIK